MQVVAVAAAAVVAVMASMARRGVPVQTARQIFALRVSGTEDAMITGPKVFTCDCERPGKREERIQSPEIMPARSGAGIDGRKALEPLEPRHSQGVKCSGQRRTDRYRFWNRSLLDAAAVPDAELIAFDCDDL